MHTNMVVTGLSGWWASCAIGRSRRHRCEMRRMTDTTEHTSRRSRKRDLRPWS